MARWRQVYDEEKGAYALVPVDEEAARRDDSLTIGVRGNFDAFVSPVDGTVIRNHRELAEHNRRNNVVNTVEFGEEHYARKAKERERFFRGEFTTRESFERKQEIHEIINHLERHNGY